MSAGGQLDSHQNLRDHSWSGFPSALNLGPSFLKAVSRGRNGGKSRGSELVVLQQVAEIRVSQGVVSGWQQARLCFLARPRYHRGMEEERGRRDGGKSRTVLVLQKQKPRLGVDPVSGLKS